MNTNPFLIFSLFVCLIALNSCLDLEVEKNYLADIYIVTKVVDGDTLYAVESYVNSNTAMTDVSVKNPDGSNEADLKKITFGYYELVTNDGSFSAQKPQTGNYTFSITFEDETTVTVLDKLTADVIDPIAIDSITPNTGENSVKIEWEKNADADFYVIRFFKNDTIVFSSGRISSDYSKATISGYSNGWSSNANLQAGDSLDVIISALLSEEELTNYTEFQAISNSEPATVVWPN